jgi:hypothetical protein
MVDFKKHVKQHVDVKRALQGPEVVDPVQRVNYPVVTHVILNAPVLETALHREMRDPQYLASLELYVDTRS